MRQMALWHWCWKCVFPVTQLDIVSLVDTTIYKWQHTYVRTDSDLKFVVNPPYGTMLVIEQTNIYLSRLMGCDRVCVIDQEGAPLVIDMDVGMREKILTILAVNPYAVLRLWHLCGTRVLVRVAHEDRNWIQFDGVEKLLKIGAVLAMLFALREELFFRC